MEMNVFTSNINYISNYFQPWLGEVKLSGYSYYSINFI